MGRITIKDVAREAGVSPSAVSRVYTEGASSSARMRAKVEAAAERLGYRPSLLARGLVRRKTNLVALVHGSMSDPFDCQFIDLFSRAMADRGARLLLVAAGSQAAAGADLLQALDYQADAVVVSAGTMSLDHSAQCVRAGLPVVLAGRVVEAPGVDCVLADNADGGRQAGELLIRTGCGTLAYLGQGGATFSDRERAAGFAEAARAAGLRILTEAVPDRSDAAAVAAAIRLFTRTPRPDGVFCSNDTLAIAAIEAARALGLNVPDDVAIVGFNNGALASRRTFRLTTLDYPVGDVVDHIVDLLQSRLAAPDRASIVQRIPTRLVVRASTRERLTY